MREIHNPTYQRVMILLERERMREQRSQRNLYSSGGIAASVENDEISSVEAGFMQGYLAA